MPHPSGNCTCLTGWYVPKGCTTNYGCISTIKLSGNYVCLNCDEASHFVYNASTLLCQCAIGYKALSDGCY